jgi:hypothetical protein
MVRPLWATSRYNSCSPKANPQELLDGSKYTAFTPKGKNIDVKQIGRELGSVQRDGNRVRVNAQLLIGSERRSPKAS